jgi:hypothetical protein
MISREELARELFTTWWSRIRAPLSWWEASKSEQDEWLRVADRALELLKGEKP